MAKIYKTNRIWYFISRFAILYIPHFILVIWNHVMLRNVSKRTDYEYILDRVNYYCKLVPGKSVLLSSDSDTIGKRRRVHPTTYFLDFFSYACSFPRRFKYNLCPGDVNYIPSSPSVVKSRPVKGNGIENAVLLNMDKIRHFVFVDENTKWETKENMVIFRGAIGQKEGSEYKKNRYDFMMKFFGHSMCDVGEVACNNGCVNEEWRKSPLPISDHLKYKFIMSLEGNDVASNLKWVMSSNSIAVMPAPKYETWFMEGRLIPDYHYVEIKNDYSDLIEKLNYYISHPQEANQIIRHAHEYVEQFRNSRREKIISLMVLKKYFYCTNSL